MLSEFSTDSAGLAGDMASASAVSELCVSPLLGVVSDLLLLPGSALVAPPFVLPAPLVSLSSVLVSPLVLSPPLGLDVGS
ncbi:hypothetical protein [Nocardia caishijiensis]|uniref:hypothetical protein n=1 Tax=Nocardia caishijiensis TaxID=184756 RepID=UPI0012ED5A25|nr:hypothetical protein [Nocardia caishijiensis]